MCSLEAMWMGGPCAAPGSSLSRPRGTSAARSPFLKASSSWPEAPATSSSRQRRLRRAAVAQRRAAGSASDDSSASDVALRRRIEGGLADAATYQLQRRIIGMSNRIDVIDSRMAAFDIRFSDSFSDIVAPGLTAPFPTLPAFPFADGTKIGEAPLLFSLFENDDSKVADITTDMLETRLLAQAESTREQLESRLLEQSESAREQLETRLLEQSETAREQQETFARPLEAPASWNSLSSWLRTRAVSLKARRRPCPAWTPLQGCWRPAWSC